MEIIAEVDRKIDDGHAQRGSFRFSRYDGTTDTGLIAAATANSCVGTTNTWDVAAGQSNCGGASLF